MLGIIYHCRLSVCLLVGYLPTRYPLTARWVLRGWLQRTEPTGVLLVERTGNEQTDGKEREVYGRTDERVRVPTVNNDALE